MTDPSKGAAQVASHPPLPSPSKQYFDETPGAKNLNSSPSTLTPISFAEAAKSISLSDLTSVHKTVCAREALLVGIAAGFGFGGIRLVLRSTVKSAANWAVGTFCGGSLVSYEMCHYRRVKEIQGILKAKDIMEKKMIERKQKEERAKIEAERKEKEAARRWWKPWT